MTTKQQTLTEILTACAGATVPCQVCNGLGTYPELFGFELEQVEQEPHDACNGTGRVYVLGGEVRIPCPNIKADAFGQLKRY